MKNKVLIVGPSNLHLPFLEKLIKDDYYIIAVDGGADGLIRLSKLPDLVVGDLDSINKNVLEIINKKGVKTLKFNTDKDESDLELSINYATMNGFKEFIFTGFLVGKISHELFNLEIFKDLKKRGYKVSVREKNARLEFIKTNEILKVPSDIAVSVLPITKEINIRLTGFRWNLDNETIYRGKTRTLSNYTIDDAIIKLNKGMAIVIMESNKKRA